MAKEISIFDIKSYFLGKASSKKRQDFENEKGKAISFLRNRYSISDEDIEDIYQESLSALYLNIENGKLRELTCPFTSYFLQICNNQALKIVNKRKGIKKKDVGNVFRPGFTTKKRGWGLGLSLAKRIVEEYHKGHIYVKQSEVGRGTTFRIELHGLKK